MSLSEMFFVLGKLQFVKNHIIINLNNKLSAKVLMMNNYRYTCSVIFIFIKDFQTQVTQKYVLIYYYPISILYILYIFCFLFAIFRFKYLFLSFLISISPKIVFNILVSQKGWLFRIHLILAFS